MSSHKSCTLCLSHLCIIPIFPGLLPTHGHSLFWHYSGWLIMLSCLSLTESFKSCLKTSIKLNTPWSSNERLWVSCVFGPFCALASIRKLHQPGEVPADPFMERVQSQERVEGEACCLQLYKAPCVMCCMGMTSPAEWSYWTSYGCSLTVTEQTWLI